MKSAILLCIAGAAGAVLAAFAVTHAGADTAETVIAVSAKRFEYSPSEIVLKKGVPVILELKALDRVHGVNIPQLGLRADVFPDQVVRVRLVPTTVGRFIFHCDVFCGEDHEDMAGEIVVVE
jgi:cytochrome c oxidase subunit II